MIETFPHAEALADAAAQAVAAQLAASLRSQSRAALVATGLDGTGHLHGAAEQQHQHREHHQPREQGCVREPFRRQEQQRERRGQTTNAAPCNQHISIHIRDCAMSAYLKKSTDPPMICDISKNQGDFPHATPSTSARA